MGAGLRWRKRRLGVVLLAALGAGVLCGCSGMSVETTWSPDNARVAYGSENKMNLYEVATKQSKETAVEGVVWAPSWSPDGKKIAFYAQRSEGKLWADLEVMSTESGQVRTLASNVWQMPPKAAKTGSKKSSDVDLEPGLLSLLLTATISWSPDSNRLVCTSPTPTAGGALLVDLSSGEAKPILRGRHTVSALSWSPDGRHIAYLALPFLPAELEAESDQNHGSWPGLGSECTLGLCDAEAGASSKLCGFPAQGWAMGVPLEWSADSGEVGFVMNDLQYSERAIGCIIAAKSGATVRPAVRGLTTEAAWAPGLKGLAFVEDRDDKQAVLIYRGVAPPVRKVMGQIPNWFTEQNGSGESSGNPSRSLPGFSRDGRKIAVRLDSGQTTQILAFDVP